MENQRRIGSVLSFANIFVKNGVYLLYTPFLIKFIGKNNYGIFQMTTQVTSTLSLLALGFSGAYVHFYWIQKRKKERQVEKLNGIYLILFLIISLLSLIIGYALVENIENIFGRSFTNAEIGTAKLLMIFMVVNIALNFVSTIFDSYIVANQQFVFQQSRILITTLLQPLIVIPLIVSGMGVLSIVTVQTSIAIFLLFLNARYAIKKLKMSFCFGKGQGQLIKALLTFSLFLLGNDVVDIINNGVPGMIVGSLRGAGDVAVYSVVIQLRTIFFQVSLAISSVYIPQINKLVSQKSKNSDLLNLMVSVGRVQFIILLFILGGFITVGKYFISIWAGPGFESAYTLLIMTVAPILIPLSQNIGIEIQRAKNLHKFRSTALLVVAALNVYITYVFLKVNNGLIGAFSGYIFSILIGNGLLINLYNHFVVKLDMIYYWKKVIPLAMPMIFSVVTVRAIFTLININGFERFLLIIISYSGIFLLLWYRYYANQMEKKFITKVIVKLKP